MADEQTTQVTTEPIAEEKSDEQSTSVVAEKTTQTTPVEVVKPKFSKSQLIGSKLYRDKRDLLNVLLEDDVQYGTDEVNKAIKDFMGKEVK